MMSGVFLSSSINDSDAVCLSFWGERGRDGPGVPPPKLRVFRRGPAVTSDTSTAPIGGTRSNGGSGVDNERKIRDEVRKSSECGSTL